jgi:hypothetical protein
VADPNEPQPPAILASDAERDRAVGLLRDAVVAGRLTLEEFSDRVSLAQLARTDQDLATLTQDLPNLPAPAHDQPAPRHLAVCSRLERRGHWELQQQSHWRSWFGTIDLDLRQARLPQAETELELFNVFGTITVIVPTGIAVTMEGGSPFSSEVIETSEVEPPPGAPRLRIVTTGMGGTVYVRTKPPARGLAKAAEKLDRLLGA